MNTGLVCLDRRDMRVVVKNIPIWVELNPF